MPHSMLRTSLSLLGTVTVLAAPGRLSDPIGVYAVIDRVVLEPERAQPRTIQIWGTFAVADARDRNTYLPAQRGYLYYTLPASNSQTALAEWWDFEKLASTAQAVGFGRRFGPTTRIRPGREAPQRPDPYPLGFGLVRLTSGTRQTSLEYELQRVPLPLTPADGASVGAGAVRLIARNLPDANLQYVFEIEGPENARERSTPVAAGAEQTSWTPRLRLQSGAPYTWSVRAMREGWQGQPAVSSFRTSK